MENEGGDQKGQMHVSHRSLWLLCALREMEARTAKWWCVDGREWVAPLGKEESMDLVEEEG